MVSIPGNLRTIAHQSKTPVFRKVVFGLMVAMPVVAFGLGCWQVQRLKWKTDLIAKCENNLAAPPFEELPETLNVAVINNEFDYRRFKCKGHFNYEQEMFLGPRMKDGAVGYLLVTPFVRSNGGKPILVERGWISKDKVVPSTRSSGYLSYLALPKGEIEIEALFRNMPQKSNLQFDHEPGAKLFNVIDVPAMANQSGSLPVYCQMIYDLSDHLEYLRGDSNNNTSNKFSNLWNSLFPSKLTPEAKDIAFKAQHSNDTDKTLQYQEFEFVKEGVPIAAKPTIKFSNNHLQYLITWFGVSFASTVLLIYSTWKRKQYSSADKILAKKQKDMKDLLY
ncbi:SHY1 [Candida oxycetoniae]|uniref:SURF1-like protein n=1 Tax=Candida oxycetoniae TaxID=497107 RepID=A0AAI9WW93_9ASCO|nr:SHY1 [Candida oxycetoniae]KAI3402708.2 SHY1 [Candida oxycetoniae]